MDSKEHQQLLKELRMMQTRVNEAMLLMRKVLNAIEAQDQTKKHKVAPGPSHLNASSSGVDINGSRD